jgi:hypothetical protein
MAARRPVMNRIPPRRPGRSTVRGTRFDRGPAVGQRALGPTVAGGSRPSAVVGISHDLSEIPRPEHPRPQFRREEWKNLNGRWTFAFDPGKSGIERGLHRSLGFERPIVVPFCPESSLSGVGYGDFIDAMWYHRTIVVPSDWNGRRILLHFGGVDFMCEAYVDGTFVGRHYGGNASFSFDISRHVRAGVSHHLVLHVRDEVRTRVQPSGKQCPFFKSRGCEYSRVTGVWQTVWMEASGVEGFESCHVMPDLDNGRLVIVPVFHAIGRGHVWRATASADGQEVGRSDAFAATGIPIQLQLQDPRAWSPDDPFLYDLTFEVFDASGVLVDRVSSYAGLRKIHIEGNRIFLNNRPLYQRLVLAQGYFPEGIWTAPSDAALKHDIEIARDIGFNGARLHQKIFEERFHYWADRLGYLTWVEGPIFLNDVGSPLLARNFLSEWREIVTRLRNHPSVIAWTPFNETWTLSDAEAEHKRLVFDAYQLTRAIDPTRPVNDASGGIHVHTDIYTVHCYEQEPDRLREMLAGDDRVPVWRPHGEREAPYNGQPYIVDEFGGIKWIPPGRAPYADNSWGYGDTPRSLEEFYRRLHGQVRAIRSVPNCVGFCYTQLTDVEQEENGLYTYAREAKFDLGRLRAAIAQE